MKVKPTIHAELTPGGVYKEYNDPTIQEYKANNFIVTNVATPKVYTGEILESVDVPQQTLSGNRYYLDEQKKMKSKKIGLCLGLAAVVVLFLIFKRK